MLGNSRNYLRIGHRKLQCVAVMVGCVVVVLMLCGCYDSLNQYSAVVDFEGQRWDEGDTVRFRFKPTDFKTAGRVDMALRYSPKEDKPKEDKPKEDKPQKGKLQYIQSDTIYIVVRTSNSPTIYAQDTVPVVLENYTPSTQQIKTVEMGYKRNIGWTSLRNYTLEVWPLENLNNIYSISTEVRSARAVK